MGISTGISTGIVPGVVGGELTGSDREPERAVLENVVGAGDGFLGGVPAGGRFPILGAYAAQAARPPVQV